MITTYASRETIQEITNALTTGNLPRLKRIHRSDEILLSFPITNWRAYPIHFAAKHGHSAIIQFLLEQFPEMINQQDDRGITPIYLGVLERHHNAVELLLDAGADTDLPAPIGRFEQIIHLAICNSDEPMVDLLLSNNPALINSLTVKGESPLMLAILEDNSNMVRYLLKNDANVCGLFPDPQELAQFYTLIKWDYNFATSVSMKQTLGYHGMFSDKRNKLDTLSNNRHQSAEAQEEYDKNYGLSLWMTNNPGL